VELHGGTVQETGDGHCVVRLPAAVEGATSPASGALPHRVLIVDDNGDASDSLGMVLQILGVEFRTAYDGSDALRAAETFRPDVVLLDIGLPDLDGYEVARRLRATPWGAGLVLIAVTGWGEDDDRRRAAEAGFDHHLVKPVAPEALVALLGSLPAGRGDARR
jgi:DNA-binding response OmpR family regulator